MTNRFCTVMNEGLNVRFCTLLKVNVAHAHAYMYIDFATLVSTFSSVRARFFPRIAAYFIEPVKIFSLSANYTP